MVSPGRRTARYPEAPWPLPGWMAGRLPLGVGRPAHDHIYSVSAVCLSMVICSTALAVYLLRTTAVNVCPEDVNPIHAYRVGLIQGLDGWGIQLQHARKTGSYVSSPVATSRRRHP